MDRGLKSWVAEFIGTFTLCLAGQGAICAQALLPSGGGGLLTVAFAHGLALVVMISALGAVSGGHFNPAVTFGFVVTGRQSPISGVIYWVSQLLGALAATALVITLFPDPVWRGVNAGAPALAGDLRPFGGLLAEIVMTFFLVVAVWGTAVDERHPPLGGLVIGLTVTLDILFGGPLTGAAMNPARAFGAAALSGAWSAHWIYWVGPLIGGALAALLYQGLMLERSPARS